MLGWDGIRAERPPGSPHEGSVMAQRVHWALAVVAILATAVPAEARTPAVDPFDGDPATTERLDVADPTSGAIRMSQVRFAAETAPYAVLSRNDDFADSLAGAPLTGKGPMLLTSPDALAPATLDELLRVLPDGGTLYALGGPVAISEVVVGQLTDAGLRVTRLAGTSRVETAVRVAEQVRQFNPDSSWVALARSEGPADNPSAGWADSVTGGAWAAAFPTPVLVTPTDSLHPAVDAALRVWGPERTILFGGATALSDSVAAAVPNPQRVAGAERSGTAFEIAERLWGSTGRYLLINGYAADGWAYGLPAAGLAADLRAPLLLADQTSIPQPTLSRLGLGCGSGQPVVDVLVVGGRAALGEEIAVAADQQDGGACPQPDDYDLAVQLPLRRTGLFETCPPPPQSPLIPGDARCVSVLEAAMDVDSTPDRVIIWQAPDGRRPVLVVPSTTRQAQRLDQRRRIQLRARPVQLWGRVHRGRRRRRRQRGPAVGRLRSQHRQRGRARHRSRPRRDRPLHFRVEQLLRWSVQLLRRRCRSARRRLPVDGGWHIPQRRLVHARR